MCRSPFLGLVMSGILLLLGGGCRTHGPTFDPYGTGGRFVTNRLETTVVTNQLDASLLEPPQTRSWVQMAKSTIISCLGFKSGD
jgi:hypothetical protein